VEITFKPSYFKDLKSVPSQVQSAAKKTIEILRKSERLEISKLDITKMEGQKKDENYYRIRIGEYRIGFEFLKPDIYVICLLHRGTIYKKFPPKL
jgi:mRNA-degrading endonuclease RelE of RelBE toxin-antitoxin system